MLHHQSQHMNWADLRTVNRGCVRRLLSAYGSAGCDSNWARRSTESESCYLSWERLSAFTESLHIKVVSLRLTTYYECCCPESAGCRYETKVLIGTFSSDNFSWLSLWKKLVSKQKGATLKFFFMLWKFSSSLVCKSWKDFISLSTLSVVFTERNPYGSFL